MSSPPQPPTPTSPRLTRECAHVLQRGLAALVAAGAPSTSPLPPQPSTSSPHLYACRQVTMNRCHDDGYWGSSIRLGVVALLEDCPPVGGAFGVWPRSHSRLFFKPTEEQKGEPTPADSGPQLGDVESPATKKMSESCVGRVWQATATRARPMSRSSTRFGRTQSPCAPFPSRPECVRPISYQQQLAPTAGCAHA